MTAPTLTSQPQRQDQRPGPTGTEPPGCPPLSWHILTGSFPPTLGGVADYTAQLARALVAEGCAVHVYCRGDAAEPDREPDGVVVHRVAGQFGLVGLAHLDREFSRASGPRLILVQYVPHAFGLRAMNLPLVVWLLRRAWLGDEVRVMFHEVAYPWVGRPFRHNLIAATNRVMAALLLRSCTRAYVSIPAWMPFLRRLGSARVPISWTPIPSNIPDLPERPATRVEVTQPDAPLWHSAQPVVGHFGTYGSAITRLLEPVVDLLLDRRPDIRLVLLGAGGDQWRTRLVARRPDWFDRIDAPGSQSVAALRERLQGCDCLIQPYPDGVSARRSTVMAALAQAIPIVTNLGARSEPLWADGAVALASWNNAAEVVARTCQLLESGHPRVALGRRGRQLYEDYFAIEHTVAVLLDRPEPARSVSSPITALI